ncbi:MAG: hypothetical protein E7314_01095 [Clostridiales bacterium]|nr:hypothetical protein [Clostridiales bacterium]
MLEIAEETENPYIQSETLKTEKITKFIKERVNEFRCEMQKKADNINDIITSVEYEKSNMIIALNSLRTKAENIEKSQKQNSIIKRENKFVRAIRILRENSYLWQEIEKEDVIELRNEFGEIRGVIAKSDIIKAEQEIFKTKKKYNFFKKIKDIRNIKYEKIEANLKASQKEIEKINNEIEMQEQKIKEKISEIDGLNQIKYDLENLIDNYKERVMESLEKNDSNKVIELIDILNETNQELKQICGDKTMLN